MPAGLVTRDLRTGLLVEQTLLEEAGRELDRGRRVGREGALGVIGIQEMSRLTDRFGAGVASQIFTQVAERIGGTEPLQRLGLDRDGRLLLLLPETGADEVHRTLSAVATTIASERFTLAGGDTVRLTPVTGWVPFALACDREQLHGRAVTAMRAAADNLDLQPVAGSRPSSTPRPRAASARCGTASSTTPGCRCSSWPRSSSGSACPSWPTSASPPSATTSPASPTGW